MSTYGNAHSPDLGPSQILLRLASRSHRARQYPIWPGRERVNSSWVDAAPRDCKILSRSGSRIAFDAWANHGQEHGHATLDRLERRWRPRRGSECAVRAGFAELLGLAPRALYGRPRCRCCNSAWDRRGRNRSGRVGGTECCRRQCVWLCCTLPCVEAV